MGGQLQNKMASLRLNRFSGARKSNRTYLKGSSGYDVKLQGLKINIGEDMRRHCLERRRGWETRGGKGSIFLILAFVQRSEYISDRIKLNTIRQRSTEHYTPT